MITSSISPSWASTWTGKPIATGTASAKIAAFFLEKNLVTFNLLWIFVICL
jgi:hypothetical protein